MAEKEGDDMMMKEIQTIDVPVHWVNVGEKRLDAGFYAQEVIKARILIEKISRHLEVQSISELSSQIFWPGRFKRQYVSKKNGDPFLMPSDVFMFLPKPTKYVINYPKEVKVKRNWLLITRSGTVGRVLIATKYLENFVLSDDLIRIVPKENNSGFLYAYLNTWIGQAFLAKDQYGATVKHIEPHHVANIPIPRLPDLEVEVNRKILEAHELREKAQEFLLKAEKMIYSELNLPEIDEDDVEYFDGEIGRLIKAFEVKATELDGRLDASYHVPILKKINEYLSECKYLSTKFGKVIERIFIPTRFKRPYVKNSAEGIPFLQGSHIPMIKPMDVKYIWKKMKNLKNILLKKHWVLMTRSGTVGRIGFVSDFLDGWAASEHILRIIPKSEVNPGYIVAFLSSPYGEFQIKGKVYGAVVDEIAEQDVLAKIVGR